MARCDTCGSTILFGGKLQGDLRFCSDQCSAGGLLLASSRQLPDNLVQERVWSVHQGRCPKCGGPGPIDVHVSHRVWSALVMTSWQSRPRISCRSCAAKRQAGDAVFSLVLGWWGFPWGPLMTPVQVARDLAALAKGPDPSKPSPQLEKMVRINLAAGASSGQAGQVDVQRAP